MKKTTDLLIDIEINNIRKLLNIKGVKEDL